MAFSSPAEIFGMDAIVVVIVVVVVLFGSTQIPKLARSLGSAHREFKKGAGGTKEDGTVIRVAPPVTQLPAQPPVVIDTVDPARSRAPRQSAGEV